MRKEGVDAITALLDARPCIISVFELVDLADSGNQRRSKKSLPPAPGSTPASIWPGSATSSAIFRRATVGRLRARAQLASDPRALRQSLLQRGTGEAPAARAIVEELKRNAPQDLAMLSADWLK